MRRENCDVVIAGAGPTGLVLAHLLARHGVSVILAEQNAATVGEPRAVSIDDESLRTLQQIGLAEEVLKDCASEYGSEYLGPDRRPFAVVRPSRSEYGWPKRNAFRQPFLERTLAQALIGRDPLHGNEHIALRFGTQCVDHDDHGGGVSVILEDGQGRYQVDCHYFVGADGGRSRARKAIGATMAGSTFEERWLIVDILDTKDPFRETRVFCDPARPCVCLPGPDRTRRYEIRLRPDESTEAMEQDTEARRLLGEFGVDANAPIARAKVYTFHARIADVWRKGRVFLAGDAAHLTPPFAGQGMNTGVRDASNLAWKLAAVIGGRLGPSLLDTYQAERRAHAWSMIRLAINMGRVMAPHTRLAGLAIRTLFHVASVVPPARQWLAQMRFKPKPRFTAGFFTTHGELSRRLGGTMFPQPMVEHDGVQRRLDDVLGDGFAVLSYGANPAALARRLGDLPARLGARTVGCLPRILAFAPTSPGSMQLDPMLRDHTGAIGALLGESEAIIVLRPDRYVMAALPTGEIESGIATLTSAIDATFDGTNTGTKPGANSTVHSST
ncbi:MAG: 2-polyprenyl-6-methoxyphenol hydroxylase-like oxidoreductase [Xanthobacteraceae bacterium]|nr:2-polyprenyl-6-methoxyphenol hydroxylase-like oxidoreductase [Xanthobacteraceae bacterium]